MLILGIQDNRTVTTGPNDELDRLSPLIRYDPVVHRLAVACIGQVANGLECAAVLRLLPELWRNVKPQAGRYLGRQAKGQRTPILKHQPKVTQSRAQVQDMRMSLDLEMERGSFCIYQGQTANEGRAVPVCVYIGLKPGETLGQLDQ